MGEGQGLTGGYLLPIDYTNKLLKGLMEDSFIFPRATVLPMDGFELEAPRLKVETVPTVSGTNPLLVGITFTWGREQTPTETEPTFAMDNFYAWDLLGYCVVSNQWLADTSGKPSNATPNVNPATNQDWNTRQPEPAVPRGTVPSPVADGDDYLFGLFAKAASWYAEYAFLQGLGSAQQMPLGIVNAPATIGVTRAGAGTIAIADVVGMTSSLLPYSWRNAIWACSPTALAKVQLLAQYFINIELGSLGDNKPRPCGALSTLPLFVTDKLPPVGQRGDIVLFDPSLYVIAKRQEVLIDVSHHDAFKTQQTTFRIWFRLDGKPMLSGQVTLQDTSTKCSGYIVLKA
jgi:hypothetical protein